MDADQLRLVLLALGATLVVLIYGWDRYKRSRRRLRSMPRSSYRRQPVFHDDATQEEESEENLPQMRAEDEDVAPLKLSEEQDVVQEELSLTPHNLEFSALEESDYVHMNPDLQEDLPRMVIQIALVRKGKPFSGRLEMG